MQSPSGTDEFVRAGQSLRVRVTQYYLWRYLYPDDYWGEDSRLDQLSVSVKVEHLFHGAPVGAPIVVAMTGFETPQPYGSKEAVLLAADDDRRQHVRKLRRPQGRVLQHGPP